MQWSRGNEYQDQVDRRYGMVASLSRSLGLLRMLVWRYVTSKRTIFIISEYYW